MAGPARVPEDGRMRQGDDDRVLDWHEELRRIEQRFADLPQEARIAVQRVVERFRAEDAAVQDRAA